MIIPHFDYVDFVIDSATKDKTDRLERLHKRAIRTIEYPEDRAPLDELYLKYNVTSLYQRRVEHLLFFMYKFGKQNIDNLDIQRPKLRKFKTVISIEVLFSGISCLILCKMSQS